MPAQVFVQIAQVHVRRRYLSFSSLFSRGSSSSSPASPLTAPPRSLCPNPQQPRQPTETRTWQLRRATSSCGRRRLRPMPPTWTLATSWRWTWACPTTKGWTFGRTCRPTGTRTGKTTSRRLPLSSKTSCDLLAGLFYCISVGIHNLFSWCVCHFEPLLTRTITILKLEIIFKKCCRRFQCVWKEAWFLYHFEYI